MSSGSSSAAAQTGAISAARVCVGTSCFLRGADRLRTSLVPSLLAILNDFRLLVGRIRTGQWPKRVEVEPARSRHADLMSDTGGPRHSVDYTQFNN